MFTPNWKKLNLKSQADGINYVLAFLKKNEKHMANRGFGSTRIMDGNSNVLLELKGDPKLHRKKEFINR